MDVRWVALLEEARAAHSALPALQDFCQFPKVIAQEFTPHHIPAADLMVADTGLFSDRLAGFRDAVIAAAPLAQWRETYRDAPVAQDFKDRFATFEIIGVDTPFGTSAMRSFVVYQPAGLHYPWHHHPAEELYLVLAGEAEFALEGASPRTLRAGDTMFHSSNLSHALTTIDHPVMAYVLWRGDLQTKPVFTYPEQLT